MDKLQKIIRKIFSERIKLEPEDRLPGLLLLVVEGFFLVIVYKANDNPAILSLAIIGMVIIACVFLSMFFSSKRNREDHEKKEGAQEKEIEVFTGHEEMPPQYHVQSILKDLQDRDELFIYARTCKSWLVERQSPQEQTPGKNALEQAILTAVTRGAKIYFIFQVLNVGLDHLPDSRKQELCKDQESALRSLKHIRQMLPVHKQENLVLRFIANPITNSAVLKYSGGNFSTGNFAFLIYDIGMDFDLKPVLLCQEKESAKKIVLSKLLEILEVVIKEKYVKDRLSAAKKEIDTLTGKHSDGLPMDNNLRNNSPQRLKAEGAKSFLSDKGESQGLPPPLSVQLLITNSCTTTCKMCDHFRLGFGDQIKQELKKEEIIVVLDMIKALGTTSIVLSGGEPLAHPDIQAILESAREKQLKVGLLTSGVAEGGVAVTDELAGVLVDTCSWIQVSIDSFEEKGYQKIRHSNLTASLETVRKLSEEIKKSSVKKRKMRDMSHLQICYTIQGINVADITSGEVFNQIRDRVPADVLVRFKFAHGLNKSFLLSEDKVREAVGQIIHKSKQGQEYIGRSLEQGWFTLANIAKGLPTKDKIEVMGRKGNTCHALRLTLFINANGDVYPCCFLFDDNDHNSKYRSRFSLGSLRNLGTGAVMPLNQGIFAKYQVEKVGLDWSDVSEKLVKNDWAKEIRSEEIRLTANLDQEKGCMSKIFGNDFSKIFPILQQSQQNPLQRIWEGEGEKDKIPLNHLRRQVLPIEKEACGKCTRHIHQNVYLNELSSILNAYPDEDYRLARDIVKENRSEEDGIWV